MKLNKTILVILMAFFFQNTNAQNDIFLQLKAEYPKKDIVFLNYETEVNIGFKDGELDINRTLHQSKMLLNERAKLYEKESINYYNSNTILDIEAKSKVPNGKKYKSHKVKDFETIETISERYFYDDSYAIQFDYPKIEEGSICEVSYTQEIEKAMFLPSIYLSNYAPIEKMKIKITVEDGIKLLIHEFNIEGKLQVKKSKKKNKTIYEVELEDIETIDIEAGGPSFQALVPHIALAIESYTIDDKTTRVIGDLKDLFSIYSGFISQINLDTESSFSDNVDTIISNKTTELEKVKEVYNWVQKNIKYISFEDNMGGFIPRDPQKVFDRKYGDCKDMTSIIVKMLQEVGITSHYAWVGTRDLPYKYTDACGTFIDNHMIAVYYSESEDRYYHLDATNEYLPFGYAPPHIQEKQVLVYKGPSDYKVIETDVIECSRNTNLETCTININDTDLTGHFNINMTGYQIPKYKYIFDSMSEEKRRKRYQTYFAKGNNKSSLTNIEVLDQVDTLETSYDIVIKDYISATDDEIFINLNLDKLLENHKIADSRIQPVDMDQTFNYRKEYSLVIPEGYEVKYIPEEMNLNEDNYSCTISYSTTEDTVNYHYNLCLNTLWINPEDFESWNTFIKKLKNNYRENIILAKK